jgi:NAD(P)-dependent dehydrogenase (short-subunit alcohol dehydrogenase family)
VSGLLSGQGAVVTGASSGIGAATARLFASEGGQLVLAGRRSQPLFELAEELGEGAKAIPTDVSEPAQVARLAGEAESHLGRVDVVVNSAGVSKPAALSELSPEHWDEVISINLSGCFYVCREIGLQMHHAGGGAIVNVASESSFLGEPMYVAYCASKGGVLTLTKALAAELAPSVRVNAVCPGSVDTDMLRRDFSSLPDPDHALAATQARIPLQRFAEPEEVARAVLFLAAEATFATGMALNLDGGTTAVLPAMVE